VILRAVIAACLVLAACGQAAPVVTAPRPNRGHVTDDPPDEEDDRRSLEATVLENYAQLTLGNPDAYADAVASDRDVTLIGIGPADVLFGDSPAVDGLSRMPFHDIPPDGCTTGAILSSPQILSRDLDVSLSEDRTVGWVTDDVSYRVPWHCRQAVIPLRMTAVFVRNLERWELVLEHLSYGIPTDELLELGASRALPVPAPIATRFLSKGPAELVLSRVRSVVAGDKASQRTRSLTADPDGVLILPDPDAVYRGTAVREAPDLETFFGAHGGGNGGAHLDGFRLSVSPSKSVAWVVANLTVASRYDDTPVALQLRGTFVLEHRREGWEVINAHISAPISSIDLAQRVFGEAVGPAHPVGVPPW
jgi:SnoaL-like protein